VAQLIVVLDVTIALLTVQEDLALSDSGWQRVGHRIRPRLRALLALLGGRLSDVFGRKNVPHRADRIRAGSALGGAANGMEPKRMRYRLL
jgi:hypothetical protein